jgi:RNA-directed DNA polymerase
MIHKVGALVPKEKATLKKQSMKRIGGVYSRIISIDNLQLADTKARKGKGYQYGIKVHDRHRESNLIHLHESLVSKTYTTSPYTVFKIHDPKERDVYRLPYFPDRIVHHAVMNVLEPIFVSVFTADTYSCIKKRGIHAAVAAVREALRDQPGTRYCLKLDIKKFYPSVDHEILKQLIGRKIKDQDLLWLLDDIIESAEGLPIGNYLSQYFANFYLTYFDHWIKEVLRVKYYFRYADDLVILAAEKPYLHQLLAAIRNYLSSQLKLSVKENYQVFPVQDRGIDFLGYVFFHSHTRLRKTIKQRFARAVIRGNNPASMAAYWGWAKHCSSNHLMKKLNHEKIQRFRHQAGHQVLLGGEDQNSEAP